MLTYRFYTLSKPVSPGSKVENRHLYAISLYFSIQSYCKFLNLQIEFVIFNKFYPLQPICKLFFNEIMINFEVENETDR